VVLAKKMKIDVAFCLRLASVLLLITTQTWAQGSSAWGLFDSIAERLKSIGSESLQIDDRFRKTCEDIKKTDVKKLLNESYKKFSEFISEPEKKDQRNRPLQQNRQALKHFLTRLADKKFGDSEKTLNEHASDLIRKARPDLHGTDLVDNPARTIYYYLALDPKGFVENVRLIRGPMGVPMTLREAYEHNTGTDPEKAARILILLETIQKMGVPTSDETQLEIILKSIKTNIELINDQR
jgi:outer membrane lipoprotein-sorting protein